MDVDQYAAGRWIPGCQLILEWEGEDQKPVRLRHKVQLIGAKPPNNYFNLTLKSTVEGKVGQNIFYAVSDITLLIGNLFNSRHLATTVEGCLLSNVLLHLTSQIFLGLAG